MMILSIPPFDLVKEHTEFGRSEGRNTYCAVIHEFEFTCRVMISLGDFLRHLSVRSVLTSVHSVSNCVF